MKRLSAAVVLAVGLHAGLFWVDNGRWLNRDIRPPRSNAVTVTMSYRKPVKPPEAKTRETKQPKIREPEETPKPAPAPPKPEDEPPEPVPEASEPVPAKPEEPKPALSVEETKTREPVGEEQSSEKKESGEEETAEEQGEEDGSEGDAASTMHVVREAVPLYKNNPPPRYPRIARRRGYQGKVVLSVYVDEQGRVEKLWVLESSDYRVLDNAALDAVKNWVFEPGMKGDRKIAMWVKVPVRFELK